MGIADMNLGTDTASHLPGLRAGAGTGFFATDGARLIRVDADGIAVDGAAVDGAALDGAALDGAAIWQHPPGFVPVAASGAAGRVLLWSAAGAAYLFDADSGFQPCVFSDGTRVVTGALAGCGPCLLVAQADGGRRAVVAAPDTPRTWRALPPLPDVVEPALHADENRLWLASCGTLAGPQGLSLWSLDLTADTPVWDLALHDGAGRAAMNRRLSALCGLGDGSVLIATLPDAAPPRSGLDHPGSELILLLPPPAGGWDLVMGEARFTPGGLRIPLSLTGEGFEAPDSSWVTALCCTTGGVVALCRDPSGAAPPVLRLCRDTVALDLWDILPAAPDAAGPAGSVSAGLFALGTGVVLTQGAAVHRVPVPARGG